MNWIEAKALVEVMAFAITDAHWDKDFERVRMLKKKRYEIKLKLMEFKNAAKRKNPVLGN